MGQRNEGGGQLKRSLKQRHLTMIAIGGSIGTALFLATGYTLNQSGPGGIVVAYLIVSVMIFFIVMSLGEMAAWLPCSGSFQTYASKFISPSFGFAIGWSYWFSLAITVGVEVVASAIIMDYWFPGVPAWIWSVLFCVIVFGLNLLSTRAYGEAEYWFASIKVIAVIAFLLAAIGKMAGLLGGEEAVWLSNFTTSQGGLFPHGIGAVITVAFTSVFSFVGTEIIGIAAGEGENPGVTIPKAVKSVLFRILVFYIGSTFMIAVLIPWQEGSIDMSPFTMIFEKIGLPFAATIMNVVVLTATLSCANSGLYASSRMIYAMAKEGKAPVLFSRVNKKGVPVPALLLTGLMGGGAFLCKFLSAGTVYMLLVAAASLGILFAWIGISLSHYQFRKWVIRKGKIRELHFKAPFYPVGSIVATIMCFVIIVGQFFDPIAFKTAIIGVPAFLIIWFWGIMRHAKGLLKDPSIAEIRSQSKGR